MRPEGWAGKGKGVTYRFGFHVGSLSNSSRVNLAVSNKATNTVNTTKTTGHVEPRTVAMHFIRPPSPSHRATTHHTFQWQLVSELPIAGVPQPRTCACALRRAAPGCARHAARHRDHQQPTPQKSSEAAPRLAASFPRTSAARQRTPVPAGHAVPRSGCDAPLRR